MMTIFNIILTLDLAGQSLITQATKQLDITIYLQDQITDTEAQNISNELSQQNFIEKTIFQSKQKTLENMKTTNPETLKKIELQHGNPFPASIKIITETIENRDHAIKFINKEYPNKLNQFFHSNLEDNLNQKKPGLINSISKNLRNFTSTANQIMFLLLIAFAISCSLIIMNIIQLTTFHRQKEIEVMKLVGAQHSFIQLPYIFEGIFYTLGAVIISIGLISLLYAQLPPNIINNLTNIQLISIIGIETIAAVCIGIFSSWFTVANYLRK